MTKSNYKSLATFLTSKGYKVFLQGGIENLEFPSLGISIQYNCNNRLMNQWTNTIQLQFFLESENETDFNSLLNAISEYVPIPETDDFQIQDISGNVEEKKFIYVIGIEEIVRW